AVRFWDGARFEPGPWPVSPQPRPWPGCPTAFRYTTRNQQPLFDRDGWLSALKDLAATPYPDALADAIIQHNHPLLRTIHTSYRAQIGHAIRRQDPVSDRKSTRLNSSHVKISYAVFCLKKK